MEGIRFGCGHRSTRANQLTLGLLPTQEASLPGPASELATTLRHAQSGGHRINGKPVARRGRKATGLT